MVSKLIATIILLLLIVSGTASAFTVIGSGGSSGGTGSPLNTVINCGSGFSTSGPCSVGVFASGLAFQLNGSPNGASSGLSGSQVNLIPTGATHAVLNLNYQTLVNVGWFTTTFTFVPNGQNVSLIFNNSNNNSSFNGNIFSGGAGCEAAFFQGFGQTNPPNNVFAVELDSYSPLTETGSFTYSSAQIYQSPVSGFIQCPCLSISQCGTNSSPTPITKLSTSPVPLNSPATSQGTTTGHTYSATIAFDGTNLSLNMFDVTAAGSCPGASCYTTTWSGTSVATSVGASTAYVGLGGATGTASTAPLLINSMTYATR